ncbi:hypothetical protein QFZ66_004043 [Streptomyces sp. B4I13]|uniref:hypothetical protein n=1 Tax=Streptomyces sp. B4I13 TaxID=3042271 RepID=UPI0027884D33|nr:hypothetical protein [Streptomyces sp. B4I13]MDQ0960165.1 hypothetical protein [Streptomyces sp. B4I13]
MPHGASHYFGDARLAVSLAHLERTVRRTDPMSRDLSQLAILSQIVWTKYRAVYVTHWPGARRSSRSRWWAS